MTPQTKVHQHSLAAGYYVTMLRFSQLWRIAHGVELRSSAGRKQTPAPLANTRHMQMLVYVRKLKQKVITDRTIRHYFKENTVKFTLNAPTQSRPSHATKHCIIIVPLIDQHSVCQWKKGVQ